MGSVPAHTNIEAMGDQEYQILSHIECGHVANRR